MEITIAIGFALCAAVWLIAAIVAYRRYYYKLSGFLACVSSANGMIALGIMLYSAIGI